MKKILIVSLLMIFVGCSDTKKEVYICTGNYSYAYHKRSDCKGLRNCSREVKQITIKQAERMNRKPCGYCYKH